MTAKNDITGDKIQSKANTDKFRDGWDRIFASKEKDIAFGQRADGKGLLLNEHYPLPK